MEEFQLNPFAVFLSLSLIFVLWSLTNLFLKRKASAPSPLKLPIIGNLHNLRSLPHRDLHSLAKKHGPLMLLHFGRVPVLVASSADSACEIMKTHDVAFASRPPYRAFQKLLYGCRDVASAPYGEYWRKMKSIVVLQLLSTKRVQSFSYIRREETASLVRRIRESSGSPVDLSEMFKKLSNDGVCRAAFGRRYSEMFMFSLVSMELVLAKIMQEFDWNLPNGVEAKDLDMSESPGSTVHRAVPLLAVATQSK